MAGLAEEPSRWVRSGPAGHRPRGEGGARPAGRGGLEKGWPEPLEVFNVLDEARSRTASSTSSVTTFGTLAAVLQRNDTGRLRAAPEEVTIRYDRPGVWYHEVTLGEVADTVFVRVR